MVRASTQQPRPRVQVHIRRMVDSDAPEVCNIERLSFADAWTCEEFAAHRRKRNGFVVVATHRQYVVGYAAYTLHRASIDLDNLAVHPSYLRRRIGMQLIDYMTFKLSPEMRSSVTMHIIETNLDAQLFLRKQCFLAVHVDRDFYAAHGRDAYVFEYRAV